MKDLTKGNITKLILLFAVPVLIGNIFQQFYNLADTAIIGNMLGDKDAIAAVGAVSPVMSLVISFINGLANGFSIVIGRHFGAKDMKQLKRSVAGTLVLGLATSFVLTVISLAFSETIIRILGTPEEIIKAANTYITIIFAGMTFTMLYNLFSGILRAIGNTLMPLVFLGAAIVINVGLDIAFIGIFNMGVEGTALATVISQIISAILCIIYIFRKCPVLKVSKDDFKNITKADALDLYSTGAAMGLMLSIVSIGSVILQSAINGLGKDTIAAHTLARKISEMFMLPLSTIGMAASAFISQNIGAGEIERVKKGIVRSIMLTCIWSAFTIISVYLFGDVLLKLIAGSGKDEIISVSWYYLKINTPFYFVLGVLLVMRNSMQSMGMKVIPVISSIIELLGKFLVTVLLVPYFDYFGVCIAEPLIWIVMTIWLVAAYVLKIRSFSLKSEKAVSLG
ncbi:MAG TPA: MATE family efflux transporter [Ruminococcus sp.]|nr:MATE family efflux transporter [Ruminococcus sp.]